jgi:NAD(P)-dependent dehydrogenase (short-subunit alcohol dehydrogenase family)
MADQRFAGKTAVVVGGNSGIGRATARAFHHAGARVVIIGRNPQTLEEARLENGPDCLAIQADVSRLADIQRAAEIIGKSIGPIDVVFANAGVGALVPFQQVTEELWDQLMSVNLKGMYFSVQKLAPLMRPGGAVILCSSVGAVRSWPGSSVYSASKAAINALGRGLAVELLPAGLRVNVIMPGGIDTPIMTRATGVPPEAAPEIMRGMAEHTPMRRLGSPDEVAAAVLFLASADASFITATELIVDGGVVGCAA